MKYLKLIRPHQWIKNLFVIAPLIFSGNADISQLLISIKIVIIFIFTSSAIYVLNDIRDVKYDMRHPERKLRPIANGDIAIINATIYFFILLASTIFLSYLFAISINAILLLSSYLILNLLYTYGFKNIPLLELIYRVILFVVYFQEPLPRFFFYPYLLQSFHLTNNLGHIRHKINFVWGFLYF